MKTSSIVLLICLLFVSCESYDLSHKGFSPITESMLYDSITTAKQHHYLEIREVPCWDSTSYLIRHSEGNYPLTDSLFCGEGMNYSNADLCIFSNILTIDENLPTFWTTYEDVVYLLSPVDCISDALLLAHLRGYTFKFNDHNFGIKEQDGKFYMKVFKVVKVCLPVETDQFFLEIDAAGKIKVLDQKVYSLLKGACI